jgi:hypothetical protein
VALADVRKAVSIVHPPRQSAEHALVARSDGGWSVGGKLVSDGLLIPTEFAGRRFHVHRLRVEAGPTEKSEGEPISEPAGRSR